MCVTLITYLGAIPWFKRLVVDLPSRGSSFDPRSDREGFVVDKLALAQVFLRVHLFCPVRFTPPMLRANLHIDDTLYQKDKRAKPEKLRISGSEWKQRAFFFCTSLSVKGIAFKYTFRLLHVCFHMFRYSRGIQPHSIPRGLWSRVSPLRGRLLLIKVAKLLPSASSFGFCECSSVGGRELDEFPWGLSGGDDTSMTQMGMRSFVSGGSGCSWLLKRARQHWLWKERRDRGRGVVVISGLWINQLECKVFWDVTPYRMGDRHERF